MTTDITRRRFLTAGAGAAAGVLAIGACGDDSSDGAAEPDDEPVDGADPTEPLPENDFGALKAQFDPLFEPLGQTVTRIGLFDLDAGFVSDDQGDHMAIYVEPTDPDGEGWDDARYIEMLAPGMAACTPFIFETWAGIQSMDLCQEPPQATAPEEEPPIETQVLLERADSASIDWGTADLADLLAARLRSPDTVRVAARPGLEANPLWTAAEEEAPERVGLG